MKKILVAMSGGVDSSVASAVLIEKGFDVVGVSMKLPNLSNSSCCGERGIEDTRKVSDYLGIPFYVINCKKKFEKEIIDYFCAEYQHGRTPNPCIQCNEKIKFGLLLEKAKSLGIDAIATGHYACIEFDEEKKRYILKKARDRKKDQSYFLFSLSQAQLKRIVFPLCDMEKVDVRRKAKKLGLRVHNKDESQEICFIDSDYRDFLESRKISFSKGEIVDENGAVLGFHRGIPFYTIGQRKGLGAHKKPVYVIKIKEKENKVVIGCGDKLFSKEMIVEKVNWIDRKMLQDKQKFNVRIRYRHRESPAEVLPISDRRVKVSFLKPQRAITPGQAAVFYDGDIVSGGGWIREVC